VVEGPYVLRHNGWFYLFYSGNGCCGEGCHYALGVARSRTLFGPWQKNPANPILAGNETWKCPGHGSIVQDETGRCFFLYHAYSTTGTIFTGREGMLDEVKFGPDEWPTMNNGNGPSTSAPSPFGAVQKIAGGSFVEDFSTEHLDNGWQWPQQREPIHRLEHGKLLLAASGQATNLVAAVLARLTTRSHYEATAICEVAALKRGCAAGLSAFGDTDNAIGAAYCDGNIITWRRARGGTQELTRQPAPAGAKLYLRLTASAGGRFLFEVSPDGDQWQSCGGPVDGKNLPPWDRSVRVALTVGGTAHAKSTFDSFEMKPL
jgi:beta-xylosidase